MCRARLPLGCFGVAGDHVLYMASGGKALVSWGTARTPSMKIGKRIVRYYRVGDLW